LRITDSTTMCYINGRLAYLLIYNHSRTHTHTRTDKPPDPIGDLSQ